MTTAPLYRNRKSAHRAIVEKPYQPGDPIPCPDAIEDDSDATWTMWEQASQVGSWEEAETRPMGLC